MASASVCGASFLLPPPCCLLLLLQCTLYQCARQPVGSFFGSRHFVRLLSATTMLSPSMDAHCLLNHDTAIFAQHIGRPRFFHAHLACMQGRFHFRWINYCFNYMASHVWMAIMIHIKMLRSVHWSVLLDTPGAWQWATRMHYMRACVCVCVHCAWFSDKIVSYLLSNGNRIIIALEQNKLDLKLLISQIRIGSMVSI